jgi:hypothetical protein
VFHVVAYRLGPHGDPQALVRAATSLPETATLNNMPYIRRVTGGKQHSPLDMSGGMQVVFVLEFTCEADRDYWVYTDPAGRVFRVSFGSERDRKADGRTSRRASASSRRSYSTLRRTSTSRMAAR